MNNFGIFFMCMLSLTVLGFSSIPLSFEETTEPESGTTLAILLRGTYSDQQRLVDMYSDHLTEHDYVVTFLGTSNLDYALELPGKTVVTFASVADIKNSISELKDKVEFIAYDIENELSPQSDLDDPIQSVKDAYNLAHENGFKLMIAPSGKLTDLYGSDFAPYTDVYVLQYQAYQKEPSLYTKKVISMADEIREINPSAEIITQVSTLRGSTQNMQDTYDSVLEHVDGVTIFYGYDEDSFSMMTEFLEYTKDLRKIQLIDSSETEILPKIPDWVRNIFIWYGEDAVSEDELLNAIKYLINNDIIRLD